MQVERAQEILSSNDRVDVKLNGESIWIDTVFYHDKTARIHSLNGPQDTRIVSVDELQEMQ
jgi:small acid-soluble spore protein H (minor)